MGAFEKLADSVVKNHKKYIAFWIAILLLSLPFFLRIGEVMVYEEADAGGENMTSEAITAGEIVAVEFPSSGDNNSLVVVLTGSDVRSAAVRDYVLSAESTLQTDPKITNLKNVTSIYSVYRDVIERSASEIGPVLHGLETNFTSMSFMLSMVSNWGQINGTTMMVWGIPSNFVQAYDGISGSAMMMYGVPSMYAQAYDGFDGSAKMMYGVPSMYAQAWDGVNGSAMMLYGVPSMYAQTWDGVNGSALLMYGIPEMYARAYSGTNNTAFMLYGIPDMFSQYFEGNNQTSSLLYGGPAAYLQAWAALSTIPDAAARNLEAFNQSWAVLNASVSDEMQRQMLLGYHTAYHGYWDQTFNSSNTTVYLDPYTVMPAARAQAAAEATAPAFFNFTVPVNQTQQAMYGVFNSFNVTDFSDRQLLSRYTNTTTWYLLENLTSGMNIDPQQMLMFGSYYEYFVTAWENSYQNASLTNLTSQDRAAAIVGQVAAPFIEQAAQGNATTGQMMNGVLGGFNLTSWGNRTRQSIFTNQTFSAMLTQMAGQFNLPSQMLSQMLAYYDLFYSGWNASFLNATLDVCSAQERAGRALEDVAPGFIAQSASADPAAGMMLQAVYQSFNLTSYSNNTLITEVSNSTFSPNLQAMAGSLGLPAERLQGLFQYYDQFYQSFNSSWLNASLDGLSTANRTGAVIDTAAPRFISASAGTNATMKAMLEGVLSTFNLTSWNDSGLITSFTNATFQANLHTYSGSFGLTPEQMEGLWLYYGMFYDAFNDSFGNTTLDGDTTARRTQSAIDSAVPAFRDATANNNTTVEWLLSKVHMTFNLTNWDDEKFVSELTFSQMKEDIKRMGAKMGLPIEMADQPMQYFLLFEAGWYAVLENSSYAGETTINRTQAAVEWAAPQFISSYERNNATMKAMLEGVHRSFNLTSWGNATVLSEFSNATLRANLQSAAGSMGLPPEMTQGMFVYYGMFYDEWMASYSNASLSNASSLARAGYAVDRAAPAFAAGGRPEAGYAGAAYRHFNYTMYADSGNATRFTTDAALSETRAQMDAYLSSGNFSSEYGATVRSNLALFARIWNWTFTPGYTIYLPPSTSLERRAAAAFDNATKVMMPSPGTGGSGLNGSSFNYTALANPRQARNLTMDAFLQGLGGAITVERALLEEIYALGPSPSEQAVRALAGRIMAGSDFEHYPVKLPPNIQKNFVNEKHTTLIFTLGFASKKSGNGDMMKANIEQTRKILSSGRPGGVKSYVTGDLAISGEMEEQAFRDVERIDPVTIGIVILLGSLFFMSLIAPFFPFVGIGVAVLASQSILFFIGLFIAKIHYSVNILLFVILMGTGMDYCIFILARYREERKDGRTKEEAIRTSVTWAGESIATSGVAVMIGFSGLAVSEFAMLRTMGYILSVAIGIGILVALTFIPSILMVVGDRVFWPTRFGGKAKDAGAAAKKDIRSKRDSKKSDSVFYFSSAVRFSLKHPVAVVAVCIATFIPSFYMLFVMQPSYDFFEGMPKTEATVGFDQLGDSFGRGDLMPTQIVVQFSAPVYRGNNSYDTASLDAVDRLCRKLENVTVKDGSGKTLDIVRLAEPGSYYLGDRLDRIDWRLFGDSMKNSTINSSFGRSLRTIVVKVVLEKEPFQKEALDAVPVMRDAVAGAKKADPVLSGARLLVGGSSAGMYDIRLIIDGSMDLMRYLVVIGIFILLLVVIGSVLIPATAILSVGISIAWTLAATMAIFQFWAGSHVLWLVPLILFVLLMGLGMDYNIFLITRVREEVAKGRTHEEAIARSVERTGGIITICGMIMAGAFGSMMLSGLGLLQQFGFALFFSIMLDAFVVRIYLMPAILALSGKWSWWAPGGLQRVRIGADGHGTQIGRGKPKKTGGRKSVTKDVGE